MSSERMKQVGEAGAVQEVQSRDRIDMKRFGVFVSLLRSEKGMTQKQLAEKLFVSNKAVSKWENGLSLPDISLLEPLAEALGVTVPELLHGQRQEGVELTEEELKKWFSDRDAEIRKNDGDTGKRKKNGIKLYMISIFLCGAEILLLYLWGGRLGISAFDVSLDVALVAGITLMFGPWFFWVFPQRLPAYYDVMSLNYFIYGGMHMNIPGVRFNNRNWPHILKALRGFGFLVPVGWPVCYFLLRLLCRPFLGLELPVFVVPILKVSMTLIVILGGLFVPVVVAAKKYE